MDTVKNFAPLCSWRTNPIFKRCSCTAEPSCSPPQDSLTELTTVENPFSTIAVKCQNFLHPPHRHIRAPFPFFFKEARFLLLPCFELAISLHPAFRDVRYLPFPRKAGVSSTQYSDISDSPTKKHRFYWVTPNASLIVAKSFYTGFKAIKDSFLESAST